MKFSLNSIRAMNLRYDCAPDPATEGVDLLAQKIGSQLGAIEEIIDFGKPFDDVLVVKVVSVEPHPNADKLKLCKIDDGGTIASVERDEQGLIQIVCGAPNVRTEILAAWLPPGSTLPSSLDKDPFVLTARDIRGKTSFGMLASGKELAINDDHNGILEIDKNLAPGTLFASAYALKNDYVIDIENKMFTHRPDCFGFLGIARELAGIQSEAFTSPAWYNSKPQIPGIEGFPLGLNVQNELPDLVPRYIAIVIRDVTIKPSSLDVQIELRKAGLRAINNIVDLTNFIMIESGQPTHAYDYDKVKNLSVGESANIIVRKPREQEKIKLLNGQEVCPSKDSIVIATDQGLLGLGGIMGGSETEVDQSTKNIIIECANFDMYSTRRTSMEQGLFTDAFTRFSKGQSPLQNLAVLAKLVNGVQQTSGGKVASATIDINNLDPALVAADCVHPPVKVSTKFINERLGLDLSIEAMSALLQNVEFKVEHDDELLIVKAPFWRTDIEIPEDLIEEVGRLYGYDKLPLVLPKKNTAPAPKNEELSIKDTVRQTFSSTGANEVLTYSFVHGNLLNKVGQARDQAFQISNALSPDLQYFRLSLTPSLLEKIHGNIKTGYDEFAFFELGKVHGKSEIDEDGLPKEAGRLAFVFAAEDKLAKQKYQGAPYYQARKYLSLLLPEHNHQIEYKPVDALLSYNNALLEQMTKPFNAKRSAALFYQDRIVGIIGEYNEGVRRSLKLPSYCAGFELFLSALKYLPKKSYISLPRYPKLTQDISLKVDAGLPFKELYDFVYAKLDDLQPRNSLLTIIPLDIYQRPDDMQFKQITLRIRIANYERTLTDQEITILFEKLTDAARERYNVQRL